MNDLNFKSSYIIYLDHLSDSSNEHIRLITNCNEQQLAHYYEPACGLFLAESPNVIERALTAGYRPYFFLCEEKYLSPVCHPLFLAAPSVPIYTSSLEELNRLPGFSLTRGIIGVFHRRKLEDPVSLSSSCKTIAVLDRVMNPTNVGAIFRNAAALNIDAVFLTKGCSDPLYKRSSRVSMGTVFQIPWTYIAGNPADFFHNNGFSTIAMALTEDSYSLRDPFFHQLDRIAIFLGSEGYGLDSKTIASCNYRIQIPMTHGVDSLNVASASSLAFWELGNR